ncbi:MAG: N-acyl homoserine lactonase family protein [Vicinamibacterales bacterium]|nr:N-acyl homoserine lactonase family protein [Vicinamibacterales bacterium]
MITSKQLLLGATGWALIAALMGCGGATRVKLYVFDGGTLHVPDPARFQLKKEDVGATDLSVTCFLVVHPKGTLMWDACAVPDGEWTPTGSPVKHHLTLPDSQQRDITITTPLGSQLAAAGFSPKDITYLALSHYHYDHTANANPFAAATWLVRGNEHDAMLREPAPDVTRPLTYRDLRTSKAVIIGTDDYDVFGDGAVVIKAGVGHTPGHQMLYVKLAQTGGVVLCGDLYHYQAEHTLDRVPTFEFNADQTRASRKALDTFLQQTGAQLWIQHDLEASAKLKKSPAYYE